MSVASAAGRIVRVLCALLCGGAAMASPADRRTTAYYAHLDLTSTFDHFDNSWLKSEHHHRSPAAGPTWTPLEASIPGGNRSPETDEISAIPSAGTATLDLDVSYEYDLRGNRKVKNDASGTSNDATYDYDLDDRLTHESRGSVEITYGYAQRGDLTTKTVGSDTTTYLTDHLGRITALLGDLESWHYTYAPTGDRLNKQDVTIGGSGNEEWSLFSDGDTLIDYTKTGTGLLNFSGIYSSPGIDGRVARTNELGETSYYFGDSLQSVHQVTDGAGDVKRWQFTDAWGNDLDVGKVNTPMGPGDRFSFTGREKDAESGLMHYRARSYDPMTGRFTGRDAHGASNLYFYVNNDPANRADPSGNEDLYVEGDQAYWIVEERGNAWDSDVAKIWVGGVANGQIWLAPEFGGGSIGVESARSIARGHFYMNETSDPARKFEIRNAFTNGLNAVTSKAETHILAAAGQGLKGGGSIVTNTITLGLSDASGLTNSNQYQGDEFDASRLSAAVGVTALYLAIGLPQNSPLFLQVPAAALSVTAGVYHVAEGTNRVQRGDNGGYVEAVLGGLTAAGGAGGPLLKALPAGSTAATRVGSTAGTATTTVSRWGKPGLAAGDWVMEGKASWWNYLMSGKWQPGLSNRFAGPATGGTYEVASDSVKAAPGFWGWVKAGLGQRMYQPPGSAPSIPAGGR